MEIRTGLVSRQGVREEFEDLFQPSDSGELGFSGEQEQAGSRKKGGPEGWESSGRAGIQLVSRQIATVPLTGSRITYGTGYCNDQNIFSQVHPGESPAEKSTTSPTILLAPATFPL